MEATFAGVGAASTGDREPQGVSEPAGGNGTCLVLS